MPGRSTGTTAFAASFRRCAKPSATSRGSRRSFWIRATTSWSPRGFVAQGRGSGAPVEAMIYNVWTVRQGKAVRVRGYGSRSEALEAAGLRE